MTTNTVLPADFLWGGVIAANQTEGAWHEGGRGTNNIDMLPIGDKRMPVKLGPVAQPELDETLYYPSHTGIDFYHHYKDDIALLATMGLKEFEHQFHGVACIQMVMKRRLIRRGSPTIALYSKRAGSMVWKS